MHLATVVVVHLPQAAFLGQRCAHCAVLFSAGFLRLARPLVGHPRGLCRIAAGSGSVRSGDLDLITDRDAHLALLYAIANPANVHNWDDAICAAIARRELALERTKLLRRLGEKRPDEACPL